MARLSLGPSHSSAAFLGRNRVAQTVIVAGLVLLLARLLLVQVVRGERYERFATVERVSKVRATAPRGLVLGPKGDVLARNIESHRLEVLAHRVKPGTERAVADVVRGLLDMTNSEYKGLIAELRRPAEARRRKPLVVRRGLVSTHCPYDSQVLDLVGEVPYSFCSTCGRAYEQPPKRHTCPVDRRKLEPSGNGDGLHCPVCAREFLDKETCPYDDTPVTRGVHILHCSMCGRTFNDEVALLRSNLHRLPEARVRTEIQREYPYRYLASHVLGYMAHVTPNDLRPLEPGAKARYSINDQVGRTGIERALDSLLRGIDGEQVLVRRRGSEDEAKDLEELLAAMKPRATVPGLSVRLTLDLELQRAAKVAMRHVHSGAAVALDVRTGEVLAMYSKPSFDPNSWSGRLTPEIKARVDASFFAPLLNKAVHPFPPASTYKIVAAAAALEEGLARPDTHIYCPGYYESGGRRFRCYKRHGHGDIDMLQALERSCDVYFYKLGERLGMERLEYWARRMGFGEATGIELNESVGRIPNKAWYEKRKVRYFPGFALSTAVGQKDVSVTPLQLARVFAGVARGGHLPDVTLVSAFQRGGQPLSQLGRGEGRSMGLLPSTVATLQAGLVRVVSQEHGTAHRQRLAGVAMAGKTGTAEAAQRARKDAPKEIQQWMRADHAWFAGWAPVQDPRIAVVVFVEHGGLGGQIAAPIVKAIMTHWFKANPAPASAGDVGEQRPQGGAPGKAEDPVYGPPMAPPEPPRAEPRGDAP